MTGEHPNPEQLQRYLDGELADAELSPIEAHVRDCAQCSAERARSARLHEFVNLAVDHAVDEAIKQADFSALFAKIEAGIDKPAAPRPVVKLSRSRRFVNIAPALGAVALAAAVMLMVYRPDQTQQAEAGVDETDFVPSRSEIVEVDFGSNAGTVFDISLSDGTLPPVVWIDDDDDDDEEQAEE